MSIGGGELIRVFGGDGDENVTVGVGAKDVIISTGGGKNGVSITGGELIRVFGGDGDENVTVDGTAKDVIISTGGGINNVSIGGGELIRVFGDVGVENVTVNGASNNVLISTGGGKDTVSIGGGNLVTVFTGDGDDSVTISGGTNLLLAAGEGNDKILVTDGVTLILLGDGGNDLVTVSGGDLISVYGGEGDDAATVSGTAKNVLVSGWNGIDSVSIGGGDLITAVGGVGKDNFLVTGGTRILIGGGLDNDNFSITGGDSVAVFGGDGDDNVTVGGGTHVIVVGDQGNDHFMVTGGDLITVFGGLNDDDVLVNTVTGRVEVLGSEGNDKIQVLKGTQISANGGSGDDAITVSGGDQITVFGGTGNDAVSVSGGLFIKVLGGSGNDSVTVSGGTNVTVNGGTGNDVIAANSPLASNIVLFGDSGNDIITADQPVGITVSGGRGDDYLLLGRGVDVVAYGDDGNDNYIFLNTGIGNVKLKELINLDSSNLDQPSRGDDFVDFSAFTTPATFNLGLIGSELDPNTGKQVVNGVTIWLFGSFEGIYGTSANDLLIGNEKDNQIYGLGGNDTIYGLGGNDTLVGGLGDDSLIGGTGNDWYAFYGTSVESDVVVEAANLDVDTLDFSGRGVAVTVDLSSTAVQTYDGSSKIQLSSSTGLENIVGTNFADTLTGNSRDNQIAGLGGNDTLTGAAGDDVYYFAGSNAGTDRVVETAADAGSDTLDFSGFLAPIQLDLAVTSTQSFGTFGGVQLSDGMGIENVVGTGYADRLFGNARPNAIHGAGGADYIDGRDGNDNLYGGLTQVVFLDFATGTELPRGDFDYLNTAAPTGGVSAADAIIARLNTIFTGLDYRFTRNLADAQAWTATSGREFVTLVFNDGPGGGIGGESNEIDFRNLVRDGRGTINVNDLLGGTTQPAKTVANVIALTSTIAAHELGHMAGLRHGDAFGPIGSGLYAGIGASYLDQITPTYTGLFNAAYTPLHILASPLSVGTTLFDATQATYFGERELIKLSFADTGTAIREASATPGSHGTFSTATALGVLPALNVFNTIGAREAGYVPAAGQNFDWMNVSALSVSGNLDAVAGLAEKDVYSFYGTAGDVINIELISSSIRPALSNPIDGVLRVYDANGTLLYESDNDFESADANVFDLRLLTSGLFYIEVTSKTPTDTGRYEMFVTRFGPRTPNLQPLGLGDTIVGGAGSDMMYGTTANDTFRLGAVNPGDADVIDGRLGDDLFDGAGFAGANVQLFRITRSLSAVTLPTLAPIAAMTVNEGQTLTFTASGSTTATGDRLTYSLAPAATGQFPNGASIDPNTGKFTFIPTNQGAFSVKVIVASASGLTAERTFTITANNVAPTLTLNGLATLFEAGTWTGGGTATDPGLDTLTVTVNYGDGSGWLPVVLGTDHKYQLSHVYGDNGNYTVTVRVNDGDGGSDEKALPVVVTNVAPTATLSNAGDVTEGTVGVAAVSFTNKADVSAVDATSLRFAYDFNNDGVWDLGTGTYAGSVTSASAVIPTLYVNNGLLTRTVKARVIDKDGGYTDYLTSFTVFNAPPTATINGPLVVTINEGSLLNLTGTGSDVGQDTLTYLWTALGAFDKTPHTSTTTGLSFTPLDDDQYTVTFTVTDSDGASVTKTVQVNVLNVAPILAVGSVATVQPGVPFSRTVTFTDPGADTWNAEVNYGDGGGWQPVAINAAKQIALSHTYATGGNFTLQVRVTDDNGGTDTKSFPVVSNLPPVASVVGPANGVRGQVRTFTLSATDYVGDVTAGFEYRVNWGDGSPVQIVTRTANNVSTPLTHTYMTLGNFTVSVLAVDQYGAISPAVTTVIPILVAALQTSGGITTLAVGGGNDAERIRLRLKEGTTDYIVVKINDLDVSQFRWKQSYPADLIQKIEVYGNGGDDDIRIDEDITLPAMIDGGAGNDTIEGGGGTNTIYGGLGNDEIEGGDGNDVIYGGDGNDTIEGGDGNDVIDAGSGNNSVDGGDGNDTITAGSGNDTIDGGDGNDVIYAGDGNNCVDGGDGNDTIITGSGNDTIYGGDGNDVINAGDGNNWVDGGSGNDTITAGSGNDTIYGGDGNDVINAGDGNNWVDGGCGNDTINAGSGSDTLYGGDGNDLIRAGAGNDTLDGGAGNDILIGGDGDDLLVGGEGRDLLIGGFGADRLNGNAQDDILIAGYTSFDDNDGALSNIMAEWTSSGSYTSRVNNLTNGTGASGGVRLIGDDGATQTVFNDNDVDTLIGSSGQDWFFANTINDNGGAIDIVVDAAGNEIVRDTDY